MCMTASTARRLLMISLQALAGGDVPLPFAARLTHRLDEATVPVVVMAVEEAALRARLPQRQFWRKAAKLN